jgi:hypothetical protein
MGGILVLLGSIHFYWASGGVRGRQAAIPHRGSEPIFQPSNRMTAAVGVLLFLAAVLTTARVKVWEVSEVNLLARWGNIVLGIVFALRALGDLHWVGLFKTVRNTQFAILDTWAYTPLCLLLSGGCLYLATH